MRIRERFQPDWASPPGETISDLLNERNIQDRVFADRMGFSYEDTSLLLDGRATITIETARRLVGVLGASVEFWMSRDYQYRRDAQRLQSAEELWLGQLPIGDMIQFGWLSPPPLPADELKTCLQFFGVRTFPEWRRVYGVLSETSAFRTSPTFESRPEAVAAWLRQGEIQAQSVQCERWDPGGFEQSLGELRLLTRRKHPQDFIPTLQAMCARFGVAVVTVRSPSGCRASGATRFLAKNKAILQFSFRYLTDDHFWFTFFHEVGHLLLHGIKYSVLAASDQQKSWIMDGFDNQDPCEETEANRFAFDALIPHQSQQNFYDMRVGRREILRFAHRAGISPGIVVGQLQHAQRTGFDRFNGLKRRYTWPD